ncbi:sulfotransferase 1B1-like [Ostrea edulis]|uniref:sulfotransferase 1B1-like n=1 Tax=Ostrea edulis TaxID=37623 RepID=UPI0024AE9361|nr:sulfotransferase 1B1-like [Ostrea edulis]
MEEPKSDRRYDNVSFDGMLLPGFQPLHDDVEGRLNAIKNLESRSGDVIIAAYPRSGTHWLWEITSMLLKQQDEYIEQTKGTAFLELVEDLSKLEKITSPRILNTHLPYRWFPKAHTESKRKIIHVTRNPKDVFVSYFHLTKNFRKDMDWDTYYQTTITGPDVMYGGWFEYERSFNMDKENIHHMYFEELKLRPSEEIRRLATFLQVNCTDDMIEKIAHKCGFDNLKNAHYTVKKTESQLSHYRKGEIGDWKNHFTVAQNEEFDKLFQMERTGCKLLKFMK